VAPTSTPATPAKHSFAVKTDNVTLLLLDMGARIAINGSAAVDVPAAAVKDGSASGLTLVFNAMELMLLFEEDSDKAWKLSALNLTYGDAGKKTTAAAAANGDGVFGIHGSKGNSFKCINKDGTTKEKLGEKVEITIVDLRVEPFLPAGNNGDFGTSEICEGDKIPNNVVPIAVGAALAGLVVLVLVMYLIGRRQHQRGYQTV